MWWASAQPSRHSQTLPPLAARGGEGRTDRRAGPSNGKKRSAVWLTGPEMLTSELV